MTAAVAGVGIAGIAVATAADIVAGTGQQGSDDQSLEGTIDKKKDQKLVTAHRFVSN